MSEISPVSAASLLAAARKAPWLPGVADGLARRRWDALALHTGLDRATYATSHILANSTAGPRRVAAEIELPAAYGRAESVLLEDLAPCDAYDAIGLELASLEDRTRTTAVAARLADAFDVVAQVPSLAESLGQLLRAVHILEARNPDTDVSFSDPAVPFSAFVGVPDAEGVVASLRLAEGLVHEAMHLQLTLLEETLPLISGETESHWSVWQQSMRPTRGLLHGYYVFRVLDAFFCTLLSVPDTASQAALHMARRRREIAGEIGSTVVDLRLSTELTPLGREFLRVLSDQQTDRLRG